MKLNLRDLFWLILVAALAICWWGAERRYRTAQRATAEQLQANDESWQRVLKELGLPSPPPATASSFGPIPSPQEVQEALQRFKQQELQLQLVAAEDDSLKANSGEPAREKPISALIVFEHDGKTTALRVEGERQLAILESYFPAYRTQPSSDEAGGWEAKYEVFINLKHGQTYRVLVSSNSRFWSMGRGDFELRGYFSDFVAAMLKAKNPRGRE